LYQPWLLLTETTVAEGLLEWSASSGAVEARDVTHAGVTGPDKHQPLENKLFMSWRSALYQQGMFLYGSRDCVRTPGHSALYVYKGG
jgi:hypothetical protein